MFVFAAIAAFSLLLGLPSMAAFTIGALGGAAALGLGNGAVFKLVPRIFSERNRNGYGTCRRVRRTRRIFPAARSRRGERFNRQLYARICIFNGFCRDVSGSQLFCFYARFSRWKYGNCGECVKMKSPSHKYICKIHKANLLKIKKGDSILNRLFHKKSYLDSIR